MPNISPFRTTLSMLKIKSTGPASFAPDELIVTPAAILKLNEEKDKQNELN